jgi:hypothetical protein
MIPEDIVRLIDDGLVSTGDALAGLAPGSHLDRIAYSTTCTRCERAATVLLREFIGKDPLCVCGGALDMEPLARAALSAAAGDFRSIECLRVLPEIETDGRPN